MTLASRARYWLPLLPLLGLLGVTYWLDQQVRPEAAKETGPLRHDPDAVMENFSAVRMNEQGEPRFVMYAAKMQHYPDDDSTTLDAPRLTSLSVGKPTVHAVSRRAEVSGSGEEVFMHDDVEVLREASAGRGEMTLQTDYLRVLPDRNWADTDRPVAIFDARNTIHGVGLEMDNEARTLKLLSQVRSVHEPR
ncbi:MAG: LPS export ABC transporter periplasmic protein LptC [Gallionellales bacterium GWA2_60_142]|nr:MAG: LPS export ABC transporter periplasmic protein LptC [Gallionellales bacterium GWA2_60_142]HCI13841.1 LPS export ABC transporter periplasmic protein LptC [Gallionellaceae bacterium]